MELDEDRVDRLEAALRDIVRILAFTVPPAVQTVEGTVTVDGTVAVTGVAQDATLRDLLAYVRQMADRPVLPPQVEVNPGPVALDAESVAALARVFPDAVTLDDETIRRLAKALAPAGSALTGGGVFSGQRQLLLNIQRNITDNETRMDYGARTDKNPEYIGRAVQGASDAAQTWSIQKLDYDGTGRLTRMQVLPGAWADRATLPWEA